MKLWQLCLDSEPVHSWSLGARMHLSVLASSHSLDSGLNQPVAQSNVPLYRISMFLVRAA